MKKAVAAALALLLLPALAGAQTGTKKKRPLPSSTFSLSFPTAGT